MTTNKPNVQRYDDTGCPEQICRVDTMHESDDGDYVLYEDYEALQAECEQLRKDAERYRWLEPHLYVLQVCTPEGRVFEICIDGAEVPVIGSLRQAIDAAMQEPSHDNQ